MPKRCIRRSQAIADRYNDEFAQGACLNVSREPRWQGEGADARRAARPVVGTTGKPCNAADAPLLANPSGPGRFPLMRRCRLLIGSLPNCVGSALPEGKSAAVAATRNTQTGSCSQPMTTAALPFIVAATFFMEYL